MYSLNYLSETNLKAANTYPGVLSLLLYDPVASVFEDRFRSAYPQLHARSGDALLVIAGKSDWLPKRLREQVRREVNRRLPSGYLEMMIAPRKLNAIDDARRTMAIAGRFGVEARELPCLTLLENLEGHEGVTIGFDRSVINLTTDDLLMDIVDEPRRVCRRPFGLSYAAMAGSSSMA